MEDPCGLTLRQYINGENEVEGLKKWDLIDANQLLASIMRDILKALSRLHLEGRAHGRVDVDHIVYSRERAVWELMPAEHTRNLESTETPINPDDNRADKRDIESLGRVLFDLHSHTPSSQTRSLQGITAYLPFMGWFNETSQIVWTEFINDMRRSDLSKIPSAKTLRDRLGGDAEPKPKLYRWEDLFDCQTTLDELERRSSTTAGVYGTDHPVAIESSIRLAFAYSFVGNTEESYRQFNKTLEIILVNSPLAAFRPFVECGLAWVEVDRCNFNIAEKHFTESTEGFVGEGNLNHLVARYGVALCKQKLRKNCESRRMAKALESELDRFDPHDYTVLALRSELGWIRDQSGNLELLEEIYGKQVERLGEHHPDTLTTLCGKAWFHYYRGKYTEALECFEQASNGRKSALGERHPHTINAEHGMAWCLKDAGKEDRALMKQVEEKMHAMLPNDPRTEILTKALQNSRPAKRGKTKPKFVSE